jgi:hypothetical protein
VKRFLVLSLVCFLALGFLVSAVGLNGTAAKVLDIEPPARLLPGQPVPHDARCSWEHWMTEDLFCETDQAYLTVRSGVIARISFDLRDVAVGDLILTWGQPTGAEQYGRSTYVYWGNRRAWVWGRFAPEARAQFITYSLKPDVSGPWRGFTDRE